MTKSVKDQQDVVEFGNNNTGLPDIDPVQDGEEIGFISGEKIEFKQVNDRLVGILSAKKQTSLEDNPYCYQVQNIEGEYWFWGNTVLDSRLGELDIGDIIDITYLGKQNPTSGSRQYKGFNVVRYHAPKGFNPSIHLVGLNPEKNKITFFNRPKDSTVSAFKPSKEGE